MITSCPASSFNLQLVKLLVLIPINTKSKRSKSFAFFDRLKGLSFFQPLNTIYLLCHKQLTAQSYRKDL